MQVDDYTIGPRDQNNTRVNDVLLIANHVPSFGGCFVVVDEVRSWGIVGTVRGPHSGGAAEYPIRCPYTELTYVGHMP